MVGEMKAQCIICKCGSVIAACRVPECYQETDWMKDVRKYAGKGYQIEVKDAQQFTPAHCVCKKVGELELFS